MTAEQELVTINEIAAGLKVSRKYATDRVVCRPDFPRPAVELSRKTRRWRREEVERWIQGRTR